MPTIKINSEKCKGCSLCVKACPKQCISFSKQFNKAGYYWTFLEKTDACIGCGFCYMMCPDVCIEVYKDTL
ncbi:MAG: 4Fe-4S binding protein [Endomicrobium sp.]|jgi:2-oxoglutarate ferredoxin oxidoreductase subunit delta|nr:4Fe-4S binding protein [Endomicrobium sp.]